MRLTVCKEDLAGLCSRPWTPLLSQCSALSESLNLLFLKLIFIGVELLYNVVLVSMFNRMNQPYIYMYPLPFAVPFHLGHHSALRRVPCAMQYLLISYLFYT